MRRNLSWYLCIATTTTHTGTRQLRCREPVRPACLKLMVELGRLHVQKAVFLSTRTRIEHVLSSVTPPKPFGTLLLFPLLRSTVLTILQEGGEVQLYSARMSIPTGSRPVRPLTLGLELEVVAFGTRVAIKAAINRLKWRKDNPLKVSAIGDWGDDLGVAKWTLWLVKVDTSIAVLNMTRDGVAGEPVELISSILEDDGVEAVGGWRIIVAAVLKAICDDGIELFVSKDTKTGFHVHVGVGVGREFTVDEVKKVCMLYLVYECE